jgi:hypothetical protein
MFAALGVGLGEFLKLEIVDFRFGNPEISDRKVN